VIGPAQAGHVRQAVFVRRANAKLLALLDLSPDTAKLGAEMAEYNPDATWERAE